MEGVMTQNIYNRLTLGTILAAFLCSTAATHARPGGQKADAHAAGSPYQVVTTHFTLPSGRTMGSTAAIDIDRDGRSVWVFERCGGTSQGLACADSPLPPILEFDASGKLVKSFGAGLFIS